MTSYESTIPLVSIDFGTRLEALKYFESIQDEGEDREIIQKLMVSVGAGLFVVTSEEDEKTVAYVKHTATPDPSGGENPSVMHGFTYMLGDLAD